jgi:uncharacterized membrane protein
VSRRPVLVIPRTTEALVLDVIAIAGLLATLAIAVRAWSILPEIIPVHFGLDGRPNGWGSKSIVWVFPILGLLNYAVLTMLVRFPHTFNYAVRITQQNAFRQYQIACSMLNWLKAEFVWLLAYINWQVLSLATSNDTGLGLWFVIVVLAIIGGTTGYWLRQSYLAR